MRTFLQGIARARVPHLAVVGDERALLDVVGEVELKALSLVNASTNAVRLRENSRLAWNGIVAGRLSGARMVTPFDMRPSRPGARARSCRRHRRRGPRSPPRASWTRTMSAVIRRGANTPPMSAVVITTSDWAHWAARSSRCRGLVLLGQLLGVAAAGRGALLELDADVLRAHALDLLLHLRPHVGRQDVGAEPPGGGDRLQARPRRRR